MAGNNQDRLFVADERHDATNSLVLRLPRNDAYLAGHNAIRVTGRDADPLGADVERNHTPRRFLTRTGPFVYVTFAHGVD
jgi:hypothetical protein